MEDEPILLPLVLPGSAEVISEACNNAKTTALAGWKPSNSGAEVASVAMGCEDGSIFIFGPDVPSTVSDVSTTTNKASTQRPTSPLPSMIANLTRLHGPPSPVPSSVGSSYFKPTSSTKPTTLQPSKSRVQAGISKEQVEAPKNYVDYDDEPAKLKSLLKAREPVKDRGLLDNLIPALHIGHHHHRGSSSENASQAIDKQSSYSQVSVHASSTSTSPPASPTAANQRRTESYFQSPISEGWVLKVHAMPPRLAFGRAVTALAYLEEGSTLVSLQECGTLCLYSSADGACLSSMQITSTSSIKPPTNMPAIEGSLKGVWKWKKLAYGSVAETRFLFVAAADITTTWDEPIHKTRIAIIKVKTSAERDSSVASEYLSKIGEWVVDCALETVGMVEDPAGLPVFYHTTLSHQLIFHKIHILDKVKVHIPPLEEEASGSSISLPLTTIPIPNPFKSRRPRGTRPKSVYDIRTNEEGRVELEPMGDPIPTGFSEADEPTIILNNMKNEQPIIIYTTNCANVFIVQDGKVVFVEQAKVSNILEAVIYASGAFSLCGEDKTYTFNFGHGQNGSCHLELSGTRPNDVNEFTATIDDCIIKTSKNTRGLRRIHLAMYLNDKPKKLWKSRATSSSCFITSLLSIDLTTIILGYDDGFIRRASLSEVMAPNESAKVCGEPSDQALDGKIVHLSLARNERSGEYFIVGGTDSGVVAVWALQSLRLVARWTLFATPLVSVIRLMDDAVGRLKGSIMCVANGGTTALLLLDSLEIAFTVPGGPARLEKVCIGEDNLMLIYSNDTGRLWDIKTQEFWRSMTRDKAEELLEQGGWVECLVEPGGPSFSTPALGCLQRSFTSLDTSRTMIIDLRHIMSVGSVKSEPSTLSPGQSELYKCLLSYYLTTGLDEAIDDEIVNKLEIAVMHPYNGLCGFGGAAVLFNHTSPRSAWTLSSIATTMRLLAICSILRACASIEGMDEHVNTVSMYYTTSLQETVGKQYQPPLLSTLARFWFDSNVDIRTCARNIFDATVGQMSDEAVVATVEEFRHRLPCLQPDVHKESPWAVIALLVVGNIAIARHAELPPNVVTDVANSIAMFLHDESSAHRIIGIDLSSRGLQIWQAYTDTMEILRSLFDLASTTRKDADLPSIRNEATQARLAVLHVATTCTHLFMTKLLLDVTQPRTPAHSRSIMQLLAFLIRKKPLVLYHNIPRLMEAVVKCIDPNSALRETVLDAVTGILSEVVRVYPTVDFHPASQKLVVGTNEGAAILYDLKTATRLYVLEGHKKRISACSFSPDGRRLVTVSLEESVVMVWKVGSSFTSFFYPGAPPRQGHSGSEPFKTLNFNVGSEAFMTTAATLEWLGFDWPSERNVRLRIRESTLTFNT